MSVSLSLAAGATPQMGIVTAVWAGLVAALFGGSNFNIVGPTGALSGILAAYALSHGVKALPLLAITSGVLILVVFAFKLERYIILIPASVLHGFTLGVALIIGLGQLNSAFGITPDVQHETFIANFFETIRSIDETHISLVLVSLIGIVVLWGLSKVVPKFPAVIMVSVVGIIFGKLSRDGTVPVELPTIGSVYGSISRSIVAFNYQIEKDDFSRGLVFAAVTIAVVAILETLISGRIADGMTRTRFNPRREVLGLGLANIASGLFGGIPATAALARTSLNVKSGATHKISALISSVTIAVISVVFITYFQYLPLCIVAAILIFVAINMVETEHFEKLWQHSRRSFVLAIFVALLTVIWEPIAAIGVGTAIALLFFVNELSSAHGEINVNDEEHNLLGRHPVSHLRNVDKEGTTIVYRFAGQLMYINAQGHKASLDNISQHVKHIVFSMRNLYYIDPDGADMFAEILGDLNQRNVTVKLAGINEVLLPRLERTDWYPRLVEQGSVYETTAKALYAIINYGEGNRE